MSIKILIGLKNLTWFLYAGFFASKFYFHIKRRSNWNVKILHHFERLCENSFEILWGQLSVHFFCNFLKSWLMCQIKREIWDAKMCHASINLKWMGWWFKLMRLVNWWQYFTLIGWPLKLIYSRQNKILKIFYCWVKAVSPNRRPQ